jgi:hypothetical protein
MIVETEQKTYELPIGGDRKKKPDLKRFRNPVDVEEMAAHCNANPHIWFLCNQGKARQLKINGSIKRWKRDKNRIEIPVKYGMYEYGTFTTADIERILIPVEFCQDPKHDYAMPVTLPCLPGGRVQPGRRNKMTLKKQWYDFTMYYEHTFNTRAADITYWLVMGEDENGTRGYGAWDKIPLPKKLAVHIVESFTTFCIRHRIVHWVMPFDFVLSYVRRFRNRTLCKLFGHKVCVR